MPATVRAIYPRHRSLFTVHRLLITVLRLLLPSLLLVMLPGCGPTTPGAPVPQATATASSLVSASPVLRVSPSLVSAPTVHRSPSTVHRSPSPSPVSAPTVHRSPPTPSPLPVSPNVEQIMAGMSLEQKVGQMFMTGVEGQAIRPATCAMIETITPGGIVYRAANAVTPEQLRQFSDALQGCAQSAALTPLWISIDHEGQYVTRFDRGVTVFPAAMAIGAAGDPENAFLVARAAGQELAFSGVNMVLGPVADVLTNYDNRVISLRSFGGDPNQVSRFVARSVEGYLQSGLAPVLKHFPGHGGVADDTHAELAQDHADRALIEQVYLPPFQAGIDAGAQVVMVGHVAFPGIDPSARPASLSPEIISLLRDEMKFDGVIMTDSLGMGAVTTSTSGAKEAAVESVLAGVDMLLTTSSTTTNAAYQGVLEAVESGTIPVERIDASVRRILSAKEYTGTRGNGEIEPDWQANRQLAYQVGYQAVVVLMDENDLVPIPKAAASILIVGPTDGWGLYPALQGALQQAGHTTHLLTYPGPWNGVVSAPGLIQQIAGLADGYDLVLALTWQAHLNRLDLGDSWQTELLQTLQATGRPLVVVALKSPTDLLEFPHRVSPSPVSVSPLPVYLATFGTTPGQVQSLADALAGSSTPAGRSPLPGLP